MFHPITLLEAAKAKWPATHPTTPRVSRGLTVCVPGQSDSPYTIFMSRIIIAELRRAKRASGALWVRGRESGVSQSGGGVCYKSCDAFVQPFFLAGNCARNGVAVAAFKNMFTSTTSLHKDFVTIVLSF